MMNKFCGPTDANYIDVKRTLVEMVALAQTRAFEQRDGKVAPTGLTVFSR